MCSLGCPAPLFVLIFKISVWLYKFLVTPLAPYTILHITSTLVIACVLCYRERKGTHLSCVLSASAHHKTWHYVGKEYVFFVEVFETRRNWKQHRWKLPYLTCSAHPTYVRGFAPVLCEVSVIQYMTTFKEWGPVSNPFISKFITVLWEEDIDLEIKGEENTPYKTHTELITLCRILYSHHTVSIFTGDWCRELPSQYRFCHLVFFIFLWILVEANLVHEVRNR